MLSVILFVVERFIYVNGDCVGETAVWSENDLKNSSISLDESGYCFINECTIRIKESNVLLNIINKTADWLAATNSTNLFTVPVTNNNFINHCSLEDDNETTIFVLFAVVTFIIISSSLNIVLHFAVRELRSTPGYLLIGICGTTIIIYLAIIITAVFQYLHRVNENTAICGVFKYIILCFITPYAIFKATYLFHFAYLMYQTYISRPSQEENKKLLYIYGVVNVIVSTICSVLMITLDQIQFRDVLDTYNGYCTSHFSSEGGTSNYISR